MREKLGAKALIAFGLGVAGGGLIGGCLSVFALVLFPPGGGLATEAVLPIAIATAIPVPHTNAHSHLDAPKPSPVLDVRVEILAYGEKLAPLMEVRQEAAAIELTLWDSSNIDV